MSTATSTERHARQEPNPSDPGRRRRWTFTTSAVLLAGIALTGVGTVAAAADTPSALTATVGVPFDYAFSQGAGTYEADGLPPGLVIDTSSGEVTGVPTQAGDFSASIGWHGPESCSPPTDDGPSRCTQLGSARMVEIDVAPSVLPSTMIAQRATETVTRTAQLSVSGVSATLTTPGVGPASGATIVFSATKGGQALCTAVTDNNGVATCATVLKPPSVATATLAANLALAGYSAVFSGDVSHAATSATAKVVPTLP